MKNFKGMSGELPVARKHSCALWLVIVCLPAHCGLAAQLAACWAFSQGPHPESMEK